ncbi:MAG TPA: hypothetical protein ENH94_10680 [Phycisphaerales bacterium]|nr:hypothetical protein [Phycisphaerales bacterium]
MKFADIDKQIKNKLKTTASPNLDQRIDNLITRAENTQTQKSNTWRIIMNNKMTKFAAAAAIILAAMAIVNQFGGSIDGSSVVWAEVAQEVQNISTFACQRKDLQITASNDQVVETISMIYNSSEYGSRLDSYKDNNIYSSTYTLLSEKTVTCIFPDMKKYFRQQLTEKMFKEANGKGPREMVSRFFSLEYEELGRTTINDIVVEGIEVNDPAILSANFPVENMQARLWVDIETNLPVLLEAEFIAHDGMVEFEITMDQFQWNIEFERSLFEPNIPDDYEGLNSLERKENSKGYIVSKKELPEDQQKERARVKEISLDIFQALANEEMEKFFDFLPHEIFKPQIKHYEHLSGLEVVDVKEPYQEDGSSKWVVPYEVKLRDDNFREGSLYIAYYTKSKRYIITGGLIE